MPIDLTNKPIAITGASSGIGAATAIACAKAGMPVVVAARRADKLQAVVDRIAAAGGRAHAVQVDVTKPADCQRLVDETVAKFGSLYAIFANAGYGLEGDLTELGDDGVRKMFETNFFGTLNTLWPAVPVLQGNPGPRRGHILICSSCLAKISVPFVGTYCATKAAQNHIGRAMNVELRPKGIRVSTVHPIGTRTEFFDTMATLSGGKAELPQANGFFMQDAEFVASRVVACLRRPKPEVWTGAKGNLVRVCTAIAGLFPGLTDWSLATMMQRRIIPNHKSASARP